MYKLSKLLANNVSRVFKLTAQHLSFNVLVSTYIRVNIDFGRRFARESNKLPRVQRPDDHLAGLLHGPKRGRRRRIVAILHRLQLPKDLFGDAARLLLLHEDVVVHTHRIWRPHHHLLLMLLRHPQLLLLLLRRRRDRVALRRVLRRLWRHAAHGILLRAAAEHFVHRRLGRSEHFPLSLAFHILIFSDL